MAHAGLSCAFRSRLNKMLAAAAATVNQTYLSLLNFPIMPRIPRIYVAIIHPVAIFKLCLAAMSLPALTSCCAWYAKYVARIPPKQQKSILIALKISIRFADFANARISAIDCGLSLLCSSPKNDIIYLFFAGFGETTFGTVIIVGRITKLEAINLKIGKFSSNSSVGARKVSV